MNFMRIAVISDTHDNTLSIVWIIEYLNEHQIPVAFHAGDIINPGILFRFGDHYTGHLHFVFGNNDGEQKIVVERVAKYQNMTCHGDLMDFTLENKRIFMNHYSDISEPMAQSGQFDMCIGGHDHQYRVKQFGKSVFINPGNTVTKDKWLPQEQDKESSFVIVDLDTMQTERVMVPQL